MQFKRFYTFFFLGALQLILPQVSFAVDWDYPTLEMAPRYSRRLEIEKNREKDWHASNTLPLMITSGFTIGAAALHSTSIDRTKDENGVSMMAAMGVGVVGLGVAAYLQFFYQPYASAYQEMNQISAKGQGAQLRKERFAEEEIRSLGSLGRRLKWIYFSANLLANVYMLVNVQKSISMGVTALSAVTSIAPLLFSSHWEEVEDNQYLYRKRIFQPLGVVPIWAPSPVASSGDLFGGEEIAPGLAMIWRY